MTVRTFRKVLDRTFGGLSERRQLAMTGAYRGVLDGYLAFGPAVPPERSYEQVLAWKGAVLSRRLGARKRGARPELEPLRREAEDVARRLAVFATTVPEGNGSDRQQRARSVRELSD